jgi:hypothetical protein
MNSGIRTIVGASPDSIEAAISLASNNTEYKRFLTGFNAELSSLVALKLSIVSDARKRFYSAPTDPNYQ